MDILTEARNVIDTEITALSYTRDSLDDNFLKIINVILKCKGKVVLTGIGKPGHIGKKIAATLASLGTPAFFMHPSEALHGDLGMVTRDDTVILMSYSGESDEIIRLLPAICEIGCPRIAITGNERSTLARECDYVFIFPKFEEACYMGLAPTSSTTALLALGDAIAVVISRLKNYSKEDFALHHPAGALGKKLFTHVEAIMHRGEENAVLPVGSSLQNAIVEMSSKGLSMVTVINQNNELMGIITDGDLRRMLEKSADIYGEIVENVMSKSPIFIYQHDMAVNALQKMNDYRITGMPVLDESNRVVGSILMQDIYKSGIVG